MRLYRTEAGAWTGTQADARESAINAGGHGKSWAEIEVPTDKPGLLEWLNWNVGVAAREAERAERELDRRREAEAQRIELAEMERPDGLIRPVATAAPAAPKAVSLIDVEEFIQAADHRRLAGLTENCILRMRELAREAA